MTSLERIRWTTVTCAIVGTVASSATAAPAGWTDYTVRAGDTCESIALQVYGDNLRYDLIHQGNPNLGPLPHNLKAGTVLHLPPAPPDAKLAAMRNVVEVNAAPGKTNEPLFRGNRVATQASAAADIEFHDTTDLELGEKTLVVIFGDSASKVSRSRTAADATLVTGRLRAHLAELAGGSATPAVSIRSEAGVATLGAGEAQVHVDEKKTVRLAVYKGQSKLTAQKKTVKVDALFGSKADPGKAPTPPRPLPAAPVWSSPPPALVLATSDAGRNLVATYAPGVGKGDPPAEWHVQIAREATFRDIVVDTRIPAAIVRLEERQLKVGSYFARVSAIDADKFEGPYGPVAGVLVAAVSVVPQEGHRALLDVLPHGLSCALGSAPMTPVTAPFPVERRDASQLRCSLAGSTLPAAVLDLPADPPDAAPEPTTVAAPAKAAPVPSASPEVLHWEANFGGGFATTDPSPSRYAPRLVVGLGYGVPVGPGWLAWGGDLAIETTPTFAATGGTVHPSTFAFGIPVSYRWGQGRFPVFPYATLTPALLLESTKYITRSTLAYEAATLVGLTGSLGAEVRVGPGGIYLEGGYRVTGLVQHDPPSVETRGAVFALGYRVEF